MRLPPAAAVARRTPGRSRRRPGRCAGPPPAPPDSRGWRQLPGARPLRRRAPAPPGGPGPARRWSQDELRKRHEVGDLADSAAKGVEVRHQALAASRGRQPAGRASHNDLGRAPPVGDGLEVRPQVAHAAEVGFGQLNVRHRLHIRHRGRGRWTAPHDGRMFCTGRCCSSGFLQGNPRDGSTVAAEVAHQRALSLLLTAALDWCTSPQIAEFIHRLTDFADSTVRQTSRFPHILDAFLTIGNRERQLHEVRIRVPWKSISCRR